MLSLIHDTCVVGAKPGLLRRRGAFSSPVRAGRRLDEPAHVIEIVALVAIAFRMASSVEAQSIGEVWTISLSTGWPARAYGLRF